MLGGITLNKNPCCECVIPIVGRRAFPAALELLDASAHLLKAHLYSCPQPRTSPFPKSGALCSKLRHLFQTLAVRFF